MVRPKSSRSTSKKNIEGNELLLNTEVQNHQYTSRLGIITALPIASATEIDVGDEVIDQPWHTGVGHGVVRRIGLLGAGLLRDPVFHLHFKSF